MATSALYEESSSSKAPTFNDGKVANWQYYKVKMESYLARLDLSEMLDPSTMIAQDAHGEKDYAKQSNCCICTEVCKI